MTREPVDARNGQLSSGGGPRGASGPVSQRDGGSQPAAPGFGDATRTFARIGLLSFGGPAGQIAMMHRILVDEKRWLDERTFLSALNFCMLLPGPEAMQLATYSGWRMHGVRGGLMAGLLFVLPGAAVIFALASLYMIYGTTPLALALFVGVKAAVLAIVVEALLRVARRALKSVLDWWIAAAAFVGIFVLALPFPLIIALAGLVGYLAEPASMPAGAGGAPLRAAASRPRWRATLATAMLWLAIWLVPLALLAVVLGGGHVLTQLAWFFSKLAVVTFGGAYAVLAYMAQEVVERLGWLNPGEMLDALGLAETTPGPLILVNEFVGSLAAGRAAGGVSLPMALAGAVVTLWATFAPCFLWIFVGAPYIEHISGMPRLQAALRGITAAVVGVILNLTVWFALHVLFAKVGTIAFGPLRLTVPELSSLDVVAAGLAVLAALLLLIAHRGIVTTLGVCGGLALVLAQIGMMG